MANEIIMAGIAIVSGGFSSFFTWMFSRHLKKAETRGKEEEANALLISNQIKISDYYKNMLDDLGSRYEKKFKEIVSMYDTKVSMLEDEIKLLKRNITYLTQENKELKKQLNERYSDHK